MNSKYSYYDDSPQVKQLVKLGRDLIGLCEDNKLYPYKEKIEGLTNFYTRLGMRDGLGKSIPIMRFIEVLEGIENDFDNLQPPNTWIDDTMIPILSEIEQKGVMISRFKDLKFPFETKARDATP